MTTPLDEALAEARKTLALCDVLDAPASSETRAKWLRIEAALLRAQRIEAAAREVYDGPEGCVTAPACGACAWCRLGIRLGLLGLATVVT